MLPSSKYLHRVSLSHYILRSGFFRTKYSINSKLFSGTCTMIIIRVHYHLPFIYLLTEWLLSQIKPNLQFILQMDKTHLGVVSSQTIFKTLKYWVILSVINLIINEKYVIFLTIEKLSDNVKNDLHGRIYAMVQVIFMVYTIPNNIECDFVACHVKIYDYKSVQDYKFYYIINYTMYKYLLLKIASSVT